MEDKRGDHDNKGDDNEEEMVVLTDKDVGGEGVAMAMEVKSSGAEEEAEGGEDNNNYDDDNA